MTGILSHTAGPTPTGWRVIDVWESEDAMRRFGEVLGPQLQKQGFSNVPPQVFPVHNFVNRGVSRG